MVYLISCIYDIYTYTSQVQDLTTQYTVEDTPINLVGVSIFDIDAVEDTYLQVNITCVHGNVTVRALNPLLNNTLSADKVCVSQ
jgi:hypothetical protein